MGAAIDRSRLLDAAALFRAHAGFVARLLFRAGVARRDLDDLVQDVFLVAHRRGGFVEREAKPTTWLAEVALRLAANYRRKRRAEPADDAAVQVVRSGDRAEDGTVLTRAQEALWALDEPRRLVFVLYELEGVAGEEIAASLGVPVGTVYSRLHAARRQFRAVLEGEAPP